MVEALAFQVLDVLVTAALPVAGIYADLVYLVCSQDDRIVENLRLTLDELERRGLVIARVAPPDEGGLRLASQLDKERSWAAYARWLPTATRDDLAIDEVGLWYGLTEAGREEWKAAGADRENELWELEEHALPRVVSVVAENEQVAQRRLNEWLSRRRGVSTISKTVAPVVQIRLRSGRILERGVRLTCGYTVSQ